MIHSGSRNIGKQVAEIYQKKAIDMLSGKEDLVKASEELVQKYKAEGRKKELQRALKELKQKFKKSAQQVPDDLCYVSGEALEDYLHDVEICQRFARRNREKMAEVLLGRTGMAGSEAFHTIHNYIDTKEMILRKGAIAAHKGEKVLIPINMRDGSVLAVGKGNPEWNYSAPHGAGRLGTSRSRQAYVPPRSPRAARHEGVPGDHEGHLHDFGECFDPRRGAYGVQVAGGHHRCDPRVGGCDRGAQADL